jgi:hypothetical protein
MEVSTIGEEASCTAIQEPESSLAHMIILNYDFHRNLL